MILSLILALAAPTAPAVTPPAPPACTAPAPLPASLAAYRVAHPLEHGFVIGRAVDLPAVTAATVRLSVQPSRPFSGTHLAVGGFEVTQAGTYSVAAGGAERPIKPLWLDIAGVDGKPRTSVAHGHGPACTGVTKVVDFTLKPGRYTFLATGLTSAAPVRVLIVRR